MGSSIIAIGLKDLSVTVGIPTTFTLPTGAVVSYDHDPMGRRIVKRVDGTITEKYLWADETKLLAVYDASDNLIMRFDYADDRMPVSMERQGIKYYLLYDQVGSLRAVADTSGNIVKRIDYDSFGNITYEDNLPFSVPFGFAGGLHDKDVKLVRFGARDYDPSIGRWTAKDPIDFAGGDANLFGYVGASPNNYIDPLGLEIIGTPSMSDTWTAYGTYGANWSEFQEQRDPKSLIDLGKKVWTGLISPITRAINHGTPILIVPNINIFNTPAAEACPAK